MVSVKPSLLLIGSPQYQESSREVSARQQQEQYDETLPEDEEEEDEDDRLSMVALETELQKYLHDD